MTPASSQLTTPQLDAIATVMAGAGEPPTGALRAELITGGRSNLTYLLQDDQRRWVMRTPPRAGRTPSAHDVGREYRITAALWGTDVPVARAVALCEYETLIGAPFAVADFVPGTTVQTLAQLEALDDKTVAAVTDELVGTLAALHRVDYVAVGLEGLGRPDAYAARQLRRWSGQWEVVGAQASRPLADEVLSRLEGSVPDQPSTGIVHGDYRIDNTLLNLDDQPSVAAVVDWELSTIGDPVADVAMMCAYRDPALDLIVGARSAWTSSRLPPVEDLAAAYERAGGVPLAHWSFHLALAYFKIGVIAAGIDHRFRAGASSGAGFDTAGRSVQRFLELSLNQAKQSIGA